MFHLISCLILAICYQSHLSLQFENNIQEPLVYKGLDYIADSEFTYVNSSIWKEKYPICSGNNQSPINIDPEQCEELLKIGKNLKVVNENYRPKRVELLNDHYTVKYLLSWYENHQPTISGDLLKGNSYIPRDVHFHWGHNETHGSEHSISMQKYSMEMHVVCYNSKYKSVADAKFYEDGIVVIAQFFQATKNYAPNYFFLDYLPQVSRSRSKFVINDKLCLFNFGEFVNVDALIDSFVVYSGSFTTPPCYEDITWIVPLNINFIPHRKMQLFRNVYGPKGRLVNNYRPIQPPNGRKCFKY